MLQGPAAYFSSPVYGQSHYKKFWLKKMETEDDPPCASPPSDGGAVVLKNRPPYAVNCSPLELRGTSQPSAAVKAAVKSVERNLKCEQKTELDYALALGVGVRMEEDIETAESWDGFNGGEEKFVAPALNSAAAQPSSSAGFNGNTNGRSSSPSPSPSTRGGAVTRMCADCKTVKTPLWRNGPQGPKSLCNACGIRYKKLGKRPLMNGGERPSSPPTPPISPSGKSVTKLNGKRKRETDSVRATAAEHDERRHRKKIKALGGLQRFRSARPSGVLQSNSSESQSQSPEFRSDDYYSGGGGGDRSVAAWRRRREVERIRKGLLRYGKMRFMAKDEEEAEAAVLLMAISCGVSSYC